MSARQPRAEAEDLPAAVGAHGRVREQEQRRASSRPSSPRRRAEGRPGAAGRGARATRARPGRRPCAASGAASGAGPGHPRRAGSTPPRPARGGATSGARHQRRERVELLVACSSAKLFSRSSSTGLAIASSTSSLELAADGHLTPSRARARTRPTEELGEDAVVDRDLLRAGDERRPPRPVEVVRLEQRGCAAERRRCAPGPTASPASRSARPKRDELA